MPHDHRVLRLPRPPKDFLPADWRPTHQELEPSSDDRRWAADRGKPVRVSVWDASLTTIDQARAIRGGAVLVIGASVDAVLAAGAQAVVYDLLESPASESPGAAGHAGIEGVARAQGEPRTEWTARLQMIADAFALEPSA